MWYSTFGSKRSSTSTGSTLSSSPNGSIGRLALLAASCMYCSYFCCDRSHAASKAMVSDTQSLLPFWKAAPYELVYRMVRLSG